MVYQSLLLLGVKKTVGLYGFHIFKTPVFAPQKTPVYGFTVSLILMCFTCSETTAIKYMQAETAITAFRHKGTHVFTQFTHCK